MNKKTLSVIIPVYNEKDTVEEIISKVKSVNLENIEKEIIVIDDGSNDGTREIIKKIPDIKCIFSKENKGKGGGVKLGFENATGDILIIQDGDLEYDPNEYQKLIYPILEKKAFVVYGTRFMSGCPHAVLKFHHYFANRFLTFLSNICSGIFLTDMETCYKVFHKDVYKKIAPNLTGQRFGIEPELTARIARLNISIYEVGISYYGRTHKDGKKIGWKDGVAAIWHIIYYNFFSK